MTFSILPPPAFPDSQAKAYRLMYAVENMLRELIIDEFERRGVQKWFKRRLPPEIREKALDGVRGEKRLRWIELLPHHPLYYTDFPDLRKIIERADNWDDYFQQIFARKDISLRRWPNLSQFGIVLLITGF